MKTIKITLTLPEKYTQEDIIKALAQYEDSKRYIPTTIPKMSYPKSKIWSATAEHGLFGGIVRGILA